MAIARLTHLHLTIASSGSILDPVLMECYPVVPAEAPDYLTEPAAGDPAPRDQALIQFNQPDYMLFPRQEPMEDSDGVSMLGFPSLPAPPGFRQTIRPGDLPEPAGTSPLFDSSMTLPGWYPLVPPDDARDVLYRSIQLTVCPRESWGSACLPLPRWSPTSLMGMRDCCRRFWDLRHSGRRSILHTSSNLSYDRAIDSSAGPTQIGSPRPVPHWRLARAGPLLSEISSLNVTGFGHGCTFRSTTYRPSDYAQPSGKYRLPLHHPRFLVLEWIGAPESACLLDKGPGAWLHSLSREQAIDKARQLHRDVCLMTTNILDQYALCLQGTASKILD